MSKRHCYCRQSLDTRVMIEREARRLAGYYQGRQIEVIISSLYLMEPQYKKSVGVLMNGYAKRMILV